MAVTLTSITSNIRNHLDEAVASYWAAGEVTASVVTKQFEIWKRIMAVRKTYFLNTTPATITLVSGTSVYTLPADFYKVHFIQTTTSGSQNVTWKRFDSASQIFIDGLRTDIVIATPYEFMYDILANQSMIVSPLPQNTLVANLYYIQQPTAVSAGTDTFGILDQFTDFIEYAATADLLRKGPVGDANYWEMQAEKAWQSILLAIDGDRSDQGPTTVEGMFDY